MVRWVEDPADGGEREEEVQMKASRRALLAIRIN